MANGVDAIVSKQLQLQQSESSLLVSGVEKPRFEMMLGRDSAEIETHLLTAVWPN